MSARSTTLVAVLALLVAGPLSAKNKYLDQARTAYADLEYDRVTPLLHKALTIAKDEAEEAEIYELLATMHVTYNRDGKAQKAFVEMLLRSPDYELPGNSSPKIRQVFEAAQADHLRILEERKARAEPPPPPPPAPETQPEPPQPRYSSTPPPIERPASAPLDHDSEPFYTTWWFWTAAGSVTAAVVVAASSFALYNAIQTPVPETDFGPYPLK